jgi:eukaryotic-like serine/threonine-protein kinase
MPPLQAPPGDDDAWGQEDELEEPHRRRGRWAVLAAAVLLLLLLGGGVYWLLGSGNRGPDAAVATPSVTTSAGVTGVPVDSSRYIGRSVDEVQAELEDLGLVVALRIAPDDMLAQANREFDADAVVALDPTDTVVPPASEITVYFTEGAYAPEEEEPEPSAEPTTAEPPTSAASPTPSVSVPSTSAPSSATSAAPTTLGGTTAPSDPTDSPPSDVETGAAGTSG